MILQRLADAIRAQNWFTVVLEILIVVIGLFIGLQVDGWNQVRKDRLEGFLLLERIRDDLLLDATVLERRIEIWTQIADYGEQALRYAEHRESGDLRPWELVLAFAHASQIWPNSTADTAYEEVKGAGQLGLIGNLEVRTALAYYYTGPGKELFLWSVQPEYRGMVRGAIPSEILYYIINRCISIGLDFHRFEDCTAPVDDSEAAGILENLVADRQLLPELRQWYSDLRITIRLGKERQQSAVEAAALIDAELEQR